MGIKKETCGLILKALDSKSTIARMSALKAVTSLKDRGNAENGIPMEPVIECLNHEDVDLRCDTARTLGKIKNAKAVDRLIAALQDPEIDVRIEATQSLGLIGSPTAVEPLIKAMTAEETDMIIEDDDEFDWDPQWDVQLHAARALGRIRDPKAVEPLLKLLRDGDAYDISETLLWSISQIPDDRASEVLIELLKDKDHVLRRRAAKALGNVDRPEAQTALMEALLDENAGVRINAARSLANKKDPSVLIALVLLLKDPNGEVKSKVAKVVSEMGHPQTADHVLPLLEDEDPEVQGQTIEILGDLKESRAAEKFIEMLQDPLQRNKEKISSALAKIGNLEALKPLAELARKSKEEHLNRIQAVYAVGEIGGDLALEVLKDCALEDEKVIYSAACLALQKVGSSDALSILISMLKEDEEVEEVEEPEPAREETANKEVDEDNKNEESGEKEKPSEKDRTELERKKFIIKILGIGRNRESVEALYLIVENENTELRNEALSSLSHLKEKDAIPYFLPVLDSENRDDRLVALDSLGRIGHADEEAVGKTVKVLLEDQDPYVRQSAARALGEMGASEEAVDALLKSLKDKYQIVRKAAVGALGSLGDGRAIDTVFSSLFDYEHFAHIRKDVALSLKTIDPGRAEDLLAGILKDEGQLTNHWIAIEALNEFIRDEPARADEVA
jgi:HEAT repeat protein